MVDLAPGRLFAGRYRIERPLARGGMGAIYVATHLATEAEVALKVLLPHRLESESAREHFRQEARVAARVKSDHIVRVLDAGLDNATDMPFFAMELLDGCSLEEEVAHRGRCSVRETLLYMRHVAYGLERAHNYRDAAGVPRPIVHRDLKPDNLFLTRRDDGSPLVKILDFGIAKLTSASVAFSRDIKGTPGFMAVEQIRGEPVSVQSDVWPLALITFYLLTGKAFWRSVHAPEEDLQALFQELLKPDKPPPTERARELGYVPTWGPAFDAWFARCLAPEPAARFDSAREAIASLERAFEERATQPAESSRQSGGVAEDDPVTRSYVRPTASERPRARSAATTVPRMESGSSALADTQSDSEGGATPRHKPNG